MFESKARVLLTLPQDSLDRARVVVGKATTAFKLPVSVQIVLRALIDEGLRRRGDRRLLANIEGQVREAHRARGLAGRRRGAGAARERPRSGGQGKPVGSPRPKREVTKE